MSVCCPVGQPLKCRPGHLWQRTGDSWLLLLEHLGSVGTYDVMEIRLTDWRALIRGQRSLGADDLFIISVDANQLEIHKSVRLNCHSNYSLRLDLAA